MNLQEIVDSLYKPDCGLTKEEVLSFLEDRCYDIVHHTCDGGCQGCSDCPLAVGLRNAEDVTRDEMYEHLVESKAYSKEVETFLDSEKGLAFKKEMQAFAEKLGLFSNKTEDERLQEEQMAKDMQEQEAYEERLRASYHYDEGGFCDGFPR